MHTCHIFSHHMPYVVLLEITNLLVSLTITTPIDNYGVVFQKLKNPDLKLIAVPYSTYLLFLLLSLVLLSCNMASFILMSSFKQNRPLAGNVPFKSNFLLNCMCLLISPKLPLIISLSPHQNAFKVALLLYLKRVTSAHDSIAGLCPFIFLK